jgi:hypothetical protein
MTTIADLDELALALPQTTKDVSDDGRPAYLVHGKVFCFHRSRRRDAIDPRAAPAVGECRVGAVEGCRGEGEHNAEQPAGCRAGGDVGDPLQLAEARVQRGRVDYRKPEQDAEREERQVLEVMGRCAPQCEVVEPGNVPDAHVEVDQQPGR